MLNAKTIELPKPWPILQHEKLQRKQYKIRKNDDFNVRWETINKEVVYNNKNNNYSLEFIQRYEIPHFNDVFIADNWKRLYQKI